MNIIDAITPHMDALVAKYALGQTVYWSASTTMAPDPSGQPQMIPQALVTVSMPSPILGAKEGLCVHTVTASLFVLTCEDTCELMIKQLISVLFDQRSAVLGQIDQPQSARELILPS